jgi:hypothetical protein
MRRPARRHQSSSASAEFAAFQKAEQDRWFKVINDNGIKAD